uniref:Hairy-related 3 n=1 Tax=Amphiprion percula TaxID=161767 RepID=A0A3P8T6A7_AMPPE
CKGMQTRYSLTTKHHWVLQNCDINIYCFLQVSKPLMEKKRRARINQCLDQLKTLLENYYSSSIRKRKLEKADILELTVKHLRNLQKIQTLKRHSANSSPFLPSEDKHAAPHNTNETSSSHKKVHSVSHRHEAANTQHSVWRPW